MVSKYPIIIGIDPGTTVGYAILNFNGDLIHVDSSKKLSIDKLIEETISFGKPLIVGSDIVNPPKFVRRYATDTKSILVKPSLPINFEHKKKVTLKFLKEREVKLKDKHQIAALYAALIAYKKFKSLFLKIDRILQRQNKQYLSSEIKVKVLSNKVPIVETIKIVESSY